MPRFASLQARTLRTLRQAAVERVREVSEAIESGRRIRNGDYELTFGLLDCDSSQKWRRTVSDGTPAVDRANAGDTAPYAVPSIGCVPSN